MDEGRALTGLDLTIKEAEENVEKDQKKLVVKQEALIFALRFKKNEKSSSNSSGVGHKFFSDYSEKKLRKIEEKFGENEKRLLTLQPVSK